MLLNAAKDYNIDLAQSWMVGDGESDVKAGIATGCRTALISADEGGEYGQDVMVKSVLEFVEHIGII